MNLKESVEKHSKEIGQKLSEGKSLNEEDLKALLAISLLEEVRRGQSS